MLTIERAIKDGFHRIDDDVDDAYERRDKAAITKARDQVGKLVDLVDLWRRNLGELSGSIDDLIENFSAWDGEEGDC